MSSFRTLPREDKNNDVRERERERVTVREREGRGLGRKREDNSQPNNLHPFRQNSRPVIYGGVWEEKAGLHIMAHESVPSLTRTLLWALRLPPRTRRDRALWALTQRVVVNPYDVSGQRNRPILTYGPCQLAQRWPTHTADCTYHFTSSKRKRAE
jgi:hypothetical protein